MVGTLKTTNPAPRSIASNADAALVLLGTSKDPDGEVVRQMQELKESAEHNQEVYEMASQALRDLSTKTRDYEKLKAAADQALVEQRQAEQRNQTWYAEKSEEIRKGRLNLDTDTKAFEESKRETETELDAREQKLKAMTAQAENKAKEQEVADGKLSDREAKVSQSEAFLAGIAGDLKAVLGRLGNVS